MPNPKRKHSKSRTAMRKHSRKLASHTLSTCTHCNAMKPPHTVCPACGYYKNVLVIAPKTKDKDKKEQTKKERKEKTPRESKRASARK